MTQRKKASRKAAVAKPDGPSASSEFGGETYTGEDWERFSKEFPRGFDVIVEDLVKRNWDDGTTSWYLDAEDHDRLIRVNKTSGRRLAKEFGDSMDLWKARSIHVMPTETPRGWGCLLTPLENGAEHDTVD